MIVNYSSSSDSDNEDDKTSKNKSTQLFKCMKPKGKLQEIIYKRKQLLCIQKPLKEEPEDEKAILFKVPMLKSGNMLSCLPAAISVSPNISIEKTSEIPPTVISKTDHQIETDSVNLNSYSSLNEMIQLSTSGSQPGDNKIKKMMPFDDDIYWNDVIKKTIGVNKKKFNRKNIEVIDMNDDDVMGDCSELFRDRAPKNVTHFKKDIAKPSEVEKNKHKITYLAYEAKQNEIESQAQVWNYQPRKRTNREQYGF